MPLSDEDLNQIAAEIHGFVEYADEADAADLLRNVLATARDAALGEAAQAQCPHCGGRTVYSREPRTARDTGRLMHLTEGYPPRLCQAAEVRALKSQEARDA